MLVTIHQPEHLPWLGLLAKIKAADKWIILDSVNYRKNYFQNRNRVAMAGREIWLTVPVTASSRTPIADVRIADQPGWRRRYLGRLGEAVGVKTARSPVFNSLTEAIIGAETGDHLLDLNVSIAAWMLHAFGVETPRVLSSEIGAAGRKSDLILDLCVKVGATSYLAGPSGRDYLDLASFRAANIDVRFFDFHHPSYATRSHAFVPGLSAVDAVANVESGRLAELLADYELSEQ